MAERKPVGIGLVGFGYGDGYPRVIDSRACVLIAGQRMPIIGRVAMDMITVDLTECKSGKLGEKVVLWGNNLGVDEVAGWAGTISYELLCKVTNRIPRIVINESHGED